MSDKLSLIESADTAANAIQFSVKHLAAIGDALNELSGACCSCFSSSSVNESNEKAANMVDVIAYAANGLYSIANAIGRLADVVEKQQTDKQADNWMYS